MLKYGTKKLENQMEKIKRKKKLSKKKKKEFDQNINALTVGLGNDYFVLNVFQRKIK